MVRLATITTHGMSTNGLLRGQLAYLREQGYEVVAIASPGPELEAAGQRDLSVAAVRDGITNTLRGRKEQLLRTAYLTAARSDATVANHLARRLIETQGKIPSLAPVPPAAPAAPAAKK